MTRELLKQALEALQLCANGEDDVLLTREALSALRQALEQTKQEPVAYSYTSSITGRRTFSLHPKPPHLDSDSWGIKPLYTEPPKREWVGLKEEDISAISKKLFGSTYDAGSDRHFARAIEAKLKEKNT